MLTPRQRGAVPVVAAAWALVWAALSPLLGAGLLLWAPTSDVPFALWLRTPLHGAALFALGAVVMAVRGAVSGAVFALLLSYLERGRHADELSAARLVLWANVVAALRTAGLAGLAGLARLADPGAPVEAGPVLLSLLGTGVLATVAALVTLWLVWRGGAPGGGGRRIAGAAEPTSLPSGAAAVPRGAPSASRAPAA